MLVFPPPFSGRNSIKLQPKGIYATQENAAREAAQVETAQRRGGPRTGESRHGRDSAPGPISDGTAGDEDGKVITCAEPRGQVSGAIRTRPSYPQPPLKWARTAASNSAVFTFKEKPADVVLASLKENGFTYRAGEKGRGPFRRIPETRRPFPKNWPGSSLARLQSVSR